ncbi:MAG: hypothetical protein QS748_04190 [Candidatus Endonucleobacter bathymodioli]|uniref:Uncharacterized protein n=1 Tax=Candidatus Endonucleibacter bathymodioli TaxID=539814 RepID=A0AA90NKM1_9GAMM|nr:hypothetical protein [Candidatus Endonucleobacter bathymodioli]
MESEESSQQQIIEGKACIEQAEQLFEKMQHLRNLLLIKHGAGRRYLQYTKPNTDLLKKAEQAILSNLQSKKPISNKRKKSCMVQMMNRNGMA